MQRLILIINKRIDTLAVKLTRTELEVHRDMAYPYMSLDEAIRATKESVLNETMRAANGSIILAARYMGISRTSTYRLMAEVWNKDHCAKKEKSI